MGPAQQRRLTLFPDHVPAGSAPEPGEAALPHPSVVQGFQTA